MGNWIPGDPTLVAQILKISAAYTPPPPEGFISPMTWGIEANVIERFGSAGVPRKTCRLLGIHTSLTSAGRRPGSWMSSSTTSPTMNAFEAAEKNGGAAKLRKDLDALFESQNTSSRKDATSIPATFLRVTVAVS